MKDILRTRMLNRRLEMSDEEAGLLSGLINEKLKSLTLWENIEKAALYWPVKNEVDVKPLISWLKEKGKEVYLPQVKGSKLLFGRYRENGLRPGKFGIKEPNTAGIHPEEIEAFVVPALAYDFDGYRLGFGKGFYDRLIHNKKAHQCFIGVCYDFQLLESLPKDSWDERVDIVVTERTLVFIPTKFQLEVKPWVS